jgi:hypothetical protein
MRDAAAAGCARMYGGDALRAALKKKSAQLRVARATTTTAHHPAATATSHQPSPPPRPRWALGPTRGLHAPLLLLLPLPPPGYRHHGVAMPLQHWVRSTAPRTRTRPDTGHQCNVTCYIGIMAR